MSPDTGRQLPLLAFAIELIALENVRSQTEAAAK
jgi:hypothetical protein